MDFDLSDIAERERAQHLRALRMRRARWISTAVVSVAIAALGLYAFLRLPVAKTRVVSGEVRCASGDPVAGVWVRTVVGDQSFNGFAANHVATDNAAVTIFTRTIRARSFVLHVGCGGTPRVWGMTAYSPELQTDTVALVCFDRPSDSRYRTCQVTSTS